MYSLKCLSILTVTKIGDCDLWRRARLQIKKTWNLGARRNLYLEPLLGTSEPAGTFTWNPYSEPRNLPEPGGMTAAECPRA